ncbi:MAG TPA: nucleoside-diphosphate sugar epimerase/dehydratase [Pyrinomonadaceae bacterium]|nr:nucleoside-diphosphate sugar epimerase/dehydratase [Pyrinomonadaceae bacterium]
MFKISQSHEEVTKHARRRMLCRQGQFAVDITILTTAFVLGYLIRFDFQPSEREIFKGFSQLPAVLLLQFVALYISGAYSFIWRYIGMAEIKAFIYAAVLSATPLVILRLAAPGSWVTLRIPLSIIVIDTLVAFVGVLAIRVARRGFYEQFDRRRRLSKGKQEFKRVLLIGAGRAGVMTAKEIIARRGDTGLDIQGFVDDDPLKYKSRIQGVKVLGGIADLPVLVRKLNIDHVIITIAQGTRQQFRRILDVCEAVPVRVRTIPSLYEILQGKVEISRIRDIEIEDLLGREPVKLDVAHLNQFVGNRTVLVTGAGGSIGSELARQVAKFGPANLLLVERAEFALFNIDHELRKTWPNLKITPLVADVGDESRMRQILEEFRTHVVIHAAAHKHVPMMETNSCEAVKNNVLGTNLLGELCGQYGVDTFVLISTDKAVKPSSIMGATKRVAELVVQKLDKKYATRYVAVRFGNVIGSAGSVIPIFRRQIKSGGPVTVTHPEMKRYFMTIPEAAQLVLQAGAIGNGGEIFILDMGEPVRILDLAEQTISLSGLTPYLEMEIKFTGMRPGEKLFEELETTGERIAKTRHPKIFIGKIAPSPEGKIKKALAEMRAIVDYGDEHRLRALLSDLLPEASLANANGNGHAATHVSYINLKTQAATVNEKRSGLPNETWMKPAERPQPQPAGV